MRRKGIDVFGAGESLRGISRIVVSGYKSVVEEQSAEVRQLTVLAGANSSGKSSLMQPLLLLKQTLEASYDPGPLLLSGPNVRFTAADQFLSRVGGGERAGELRVGITTDVSTTIRFGKEAGKGLDIWETVHSYDGQTFALRPGMSHAEAVRVIPKEFGRLYGSLLGRAQGNFEWGVRRARCFLQLALIQTNGGKGSPWLPVGVGTAEPHLRGIIHLPGLRGNPERNYPVTAIGPTFAGPFQSYAASLIASWQMPGGEEDLSKLGGHLAKLGLTWKVAARPVSETEVELRVGRLPQCARGGARDMVNVADVGLGVSQALPVLVALLAAKPEQLVYLEQPELHLHPRAQHALAGILVEAANRGVRVVVETHSSLLLLGIQTLIASGDLPHKKAKLHWFQRGADGVTHITSADFDEAGAFGDWPEDFGDVSLAAEGAYLDRAEPKLRKRA